MIADATDSRGGTWGPDGTIVYTPFTQAGLWRVSATGGSATEILGIEPPYTTYRWPAFLPDGRHIIYLAASHVNPATSDTAIFMTSIDGKENRRLFPSLGSAVPYGDYILSLQGSQLLAQRLKDAEMVGERIPIRENVLYDPGTWRSIVSVSSNGLLVVQSSGGQVGARLLWLDRSGKQVGEIQPDDIYTDVAIAPDQSKVVMGIGDPRSALFLYDIERNVRTRFSFVDSSADFPVWTPDSRNIIFSGLTPQNGRRLYIKPVDGTANEKVLLESSEGLRPTDVSPDGRFLLYDQNNRGEAGVNALPLAGGKPFEVVGGSGQQYDGHFSPDGRWITYESSWDGGRSVFLTAFPGPGGKWQVSGEKAALYSWWNRNGKEILYLSADGSMNSVSVSFVGKSVRLGGPQQLFTINVNTNGRSLGVSSDGSRFLARIAKEQSAGAATLVQNWDSALR